MGESLCHNVIELGNSVNGWPRANIYITQHVRPDLVLNHAPVVFSHKVIFLFGNLWDSCDPVAFSTASSYVLPVT